MAVRGIIIYIWQPASLLSMGERNEIKLKALLATDKVAAFNEIVHLYSERLYWHVRRMVHTHEDADDLLQNSFVKCWNGLEKFRGESKIITWLYTIATNEALMHIRKRKSSKEESVENLNEIVSLSEEGHTYFDGDEAEATLQNAILSLPEKQRVVFLLKYYDELDYNEMSKVTGTSVGALKASYHHAVKKIENYVSSQIKP